MVRVIALMCVALHATSIELLAQEKGEARRSLVEDAAYLEKSSMWQSGEISVTDVLKKEKLKGYRLELFFETEKGKSRGYVDVLLTEPRDEKGGQVGSARQLCFELIEKEGKRSIVVYQRDFGPTLKDGSPANKTWEAQRVLPGVVFEYSIASGVLTVKGDPKTLAGAGRELDVSKGLSLKAADDGFVKDALKLMTDMTDVLKSVKDKASAQAALPKLQAIAERFAVLKKKAGGSFNPTAEGRKQLAASEKAANAELGRIEKLPEAFGVLKESTFFKKLAELK